MIVAREGQRTAGMFLLGQAEQIGGIADLGLDLFLAIAEIIVRQDRDDHAAGIARGDLERCPVVVRFALIAPAHAVGALARRRGVRVRQTEFLLGETDQMWRQDHAAGMPRPVVDVQPRIVGRKHRVAAVAEDALDEIQVADQGAGREKTDFHALFRLASGNFRTHHGPEQERDEHSGLVFLARGKGQRQQVLRRIERRPQQRREHPLGHRLLVAGDGQPALGHVE